MNNIIFPAQTAPEPLQTVSVGNLTLTLPSRMVQRAKERVYWKKCSKWFEDEFKPDGYITLEIGFKKRGEEALKIVRSYLCKVARRSGQHILAEAFWDIQPNSVHRKIHFHIFYRFEKRYVQTDVMEQVWIDKIANVLWKKQNGQTLEYTERNIDLFLIGLAEDYPDVFKSVKAQGAKQYWAKAKRYKKVDDYTHKGNLFRYTYSKHTQSMAMVGCPKKASRCRRGDCLYHEHKENWWKEV